MLSLTLYSMAEVLNVTLKGSGFSLEADPDNENKYSLVHPDITRSIQDWQFLNLRSSDRNSTLRLELDPKKGQLLVVRKFDTLLRTKVFRPDAVTELLLAQGNAVLEKRRSMVENLNRLHQELILNQVAIAQAGYKVEGTSGYHATPDDTRILYRESDGVRDTIRVVLDGQGHLIVATHNVIYTSPVPLADVLEQA